MRQRAGRNRARTFSSVLTATALACISAVAVPAPAHAESYYTFYQNGQNNFGGVWEFVDRSIGGSGPDYNDVIVDDRLDGYAVTIQVQDKRSGSWNTVLNKYVPDGYNLKYTRSMNEGTIKVTFCVYIQGGDLVRCELRYLLNE